MGTKILIVDSHVVYRRGLRDIFAENEDLQVIAESSDALAAIKTLQTGPVDVVVLDLVMPGADSLETIKHIRTQWPSVAILAMSFYPQENYAIRALKAGAAGYLTKDSLPHELVEAVRKVAAGGKYIRQSLAEALAQSIDSRSSKPRHFALSDREFQVFCLLGKGVTVKQVSQRLSLSDKTVSTYRQRILDKMQMDSTIQIVRYVIENQIEQLEPGAPSPTSNV